MWTRDDCRRPFVCAKRADCIFVFDGFQRISISHHEIITFIFPPHLHSCGHVSNPFKAVCALVGVKKEEQEEETFSVFNALLTAKIFSRSLCSPGSLGV